MSAEAVGRPLGPHEELNWQNYHKCWRRRRKGSEVVATITVHWLLLAVTLFNLDYALVGESLELTCKYLMVDEVEDIKSVQWLKDDKLFLRWTKGRPGLEVMSYDFKGHIDAKSNFSHLIVHNATTEMHGNYKCRMQSDLGLANGDGNRQLVVISAGQCRLSDWRIASDPSDCSETLRLDCKAMFPRPVPSCGLWNDRKHKWIRLLPVHIFEDPAPAGQNSNHHHHHHHQKPQTYRVQYAYKFQLTAPEDAHLLKYAGHLVFKCDIQVKETTWRLAIEHRMFHFRDGCHDDPLETIDKLRANYSRHARARLASSQINSPKRLRNDDIEMLTSNLSYQILPPPGSLINQHQVFVAGNSTTTTTTSTTNKSVVPLNCWQKPRLGSLAKLSCVTPAQHQPMNQQLKLTGSNLLECRPEGWLPVRLARVQQVQVAANKTALKLGPRRSARNENSSASNDLDDVDLSEDNDDDDDSKPITTSMPTPSADNDIDLGRSANHALTQELSPGELAALLPTCVAVNPRRVQHQNRLPLLNNNEDDRATILESRNFKSNIQSNRQHDDKWYTFFATSSSTSSSPLDQLQGSHHYLISLTSIASLINSLRQVMFARTFA